MQVGLKRSETNWKSANVLSKNIGTNFLTNKIIRDFLSIKVHDTHTCFCMIGLQIKSFENAS